MSIFFRRTLGNAWKGFCGVLVCCSDTWSLVVWLDGGLSICDQVWSKRWGESKCRLPGEVRVACVDRVVVVRNVLLHFCLCYL